MNNYVLSKDAPAAHPGASAVVGLLFIVLVASFVLISLDSHELSSPFGRCSVCQVKNILGGSDEKIFWIDLSLSGHVWRMTPFVSVAKVFDDEPLFDAAEVAPTPGDERAPPA